MGGISDDHVLFASGFVLTGMGLGELIEPASVMMEKSFLAGPHKAAVGTIGGRCSGIAVTSLGVRDLVLAANKDAVPKTKRNALRIAGVTHGVAALWCADNVRRKEFKTVGGAAAGAVHATVAGLALWRGFRKEKTDA